MQQELDRLIADANIKSEIITLKNNYDPISFIFF
jgi:hypothetical protein